MLYSAQMKPVIAVVGAGPGIGEAVARRFAAEGFVVALLARTQDKFHAMANGIDADFEKGTAYYYIADLRIEGDVISSFGKIREDLGEVKVLVYNAGARRVRGRSVLDTTTDEFEGATGSLRGAAGLSSSSPGKFGLRSLSHVVAREYQSQGIHVAHLIIDGPVDGKLMGGVRRRQWEREAPGRMNWTYGL